MSEKNCICTRIRKILNILLRRRQISTNTSIERTAQFLLEAFSQHLTNRDDLWHVVNGPKRETWFNAEFITALSHKSPLNLTDGWRVYGEESCKNISKILDEFSIDHNCGNNAYGIRKIPDVTIIKNLTSSYPLELTILEAKLISPRATHQSDDVEIKSNTSKELECLTYTSKSDGLLDQLNRGKYLFPGANVFGLIYAVHRLGQCAEIKPNNFYSSLASQISELYESTNWELWKKCIHPISGQQSVKPIGGMFSGEASLGLGIIIPKCDGTTDV